MNICITYIYEYTYIYIYIYIKDTFSCPDSGHNAVHYQNIGPNCIFSIAVQW